MKNSAWYHKLWRDKLGEVPLKKDDATAWADMRNLLDEQLPASAPSIGKNAYKLSTLTKTVLLLITVAIITIPAVLHISKRHTTPLKNSKHLNEHAAIHNTANTLHGKSSGQNTNISIITDSNQYNSDSNTGSITQNQKDAANKFNINSKPVTVNHNLQAQNTARLTTYAKQHQTDDKFKNGELLDISATRQANLSKQNILKSRNRHTNIPTTDNKQKNNHLLISGQSSSTGYTSIKASHKAAKKGSKTETDETSITRANDMNGKAVTSINTTAQTTKASKINNDKEEADTKIDPVKSPTNNTDPKEAKNSGSKSRAFNTSQKTVKTKDNKAKSNTKKPKADDAQPKYNYGLELGYNAGKGHNLYGGILGSYLVKPRWLINVDLRLNTYTTISGEYSHQSYYSPDSIPAFKIVDSRKVMTLTIPLTLEYRLTKNISLKGGPVISIPIKQSAISAKLGAVPNIRDTVYHTQAIDSALKKTTINKLNVGFTGGVSIQIKHFSIEAMYQVLSPYKISSGLGSYQKTNQNFQIGIGYRFK